MKFSEFNDQIPVFYGFYKFLLSEIFIVTLSRLCPLFFMQVYCDPFTGHIFYSKKDVFRHLKAEKSSEFTSKKRKPLGAKPEEDRFSKFASNQNHFSVDFSEDVCRFRYSYIIFFTLP